MAAFYHWLQLRDRLVRLRTQATRDAKLKVMDEHPEFLLDGAQIQRVHAETTVIFRHLNAADHWSDHPARQAWIHSSPTHGPSRLVVNVSPHRQSMA
jgi:antibiotic biosynthesis monooxygenase (ABM) superfamily enzyme